MKLNERLQELRKKYNYSQEGLATKLDVSRQSIINWEKGSAVPSIDYLNQLATLYNISLDVLVNGEKGNKGETKINKKSGKTNKVRALVFAIVFLVCIVAFFLLGNYITDGFRNYWVIFFIPFIVDGFIKTFKYKIAADFPIAFIVLFVYLYLGLTKGYWGTPYWTMFLAIPVYYFVVNLFSKK